MQHKLIIYSIQDIIIIIIFICLKDILLLYIYYTILLYIIYCIYKRFNTIKIQQQWQSTKVRLETMNNLWIIYFCVISNRHCQLHR